MLRRMLNCGEPNNAARGTAVKLADMNASRAARSIATHLPPSAADSTYRQANASRQSINLIEWYEWPAQLLRTVFAPVIRRIGASETCSLVRTAGRNSARHAVDLSLVRMLNRHEDTPDEPSGARSGCTAGQAVQGQSESLQEMHSTMPG